MGKMSEFRFTLDSSKWLLLRSILNEVLNGFALDNFDAVIGQDKEELFKLLACLRDLPGDANVDLNLNQTRALHETLLELGTAEFHTRTGYIFEEGQRVLGELNALIHG